MPEATCGPLNWGRAKRNNPTDKENVAPNFRLSNRKPMAFVCLFVFFCKIKMDSRFRFRSANLPTATADQRFPSSSAQNKTDFYVHIFDDQRRYL